MESSQHRGCSSWLPANRRWFIGPEPWKLLAWSVEL